MSEIQGEELSGGKKKKDVGKKKKQGEVKEEAKKEKKKKDKKPKEEVKLYDVQIKDDLVNAQLNEIKKIFGDKLVDNSLTSEVAK